MLVTIKASIVARGYPPTLREIGYMLGIKSTNGVNDHLRALRKKGLLDEPECWGKSRGLRISHAGEGVLMAVRDIAAPVVQRDTTIVEVPVYVSLGEGGPVTSGQVLRMSRHMFNNAIDPYGYEVHGDADVLRKNGLRDGDVVIVDPAVAVMGKMVIAHLDGCALICKLRLSDAGDMYSFASVTRVTSTLYVEREHYSSTMVLGTVVALWRTTT